MEKFRDSSWLVHKLLLTTIIGLTALYRLYQPLTRPALLQFDVFDWAHRSKEWLLFGHPLRPTSLWVFPAWNALVSKLSGIDLFYIYLYSGAALTTFNVFILYGIGSLLWRKPFLRLIPIIFYAFNSRILARSINYLPETMSFTFGLTLVYFYLRLIRDRRSLWLLPIALVNYLYYHLHQSGLNFLFFTAIVVVLYFLFIFPKPWKAKIIWLVGLAVVGTGIILINTGIRQQIAFFIHGNNNSDAAFHGTAIPVRQFFTDYPIIFGAAIILGAISIVFLFFRRYKTQEKISWLIILLIVGFYYSFLYLLPNLKLYSLIPWRFYTWFSLYAIIVASGGMAVLLKIIGHKFSSSIMSAFFCFMIINLAHGNLIPDNMYTANAASLQSIENMQLPKNSIVVTTNANVLQARYALLGRSLTIYEADKNFFKAPDGKIAHDYLTQRYKSDSMYVLISLYQLRQRPYYIDYWRESAIYDMNLDIFTDKRYFIEIYRDEQSVVFKSVVSGI